MGTEGGREGKEETKRARGRDREYTFISWAGMIKLHIAVAYSTILVFYMLISLKSLVDHQAPFSNLPELLTFY